MSLDKNGSTASEGAAMNDNQNGHIRNGEDDLDEMPKKRVKLEPSNANTSSRDGDEIYENQPGRRKGVAPIKKEFLVDIGQGAATEGHVDDDAAEASGKAPAEMLGGRGGKKTKGGQNHGRQFGSSRDEIGLCKSRALSNEFAPNRCPFGDDCRWEHDIRKYLKDGKRPDLDTFQGKCPTFERKGKCSAGWRCRFASGHSKEIEHDDGRKELVLIDQHGTPLENGEPREDETKGVTNVVSHDQKIVLRKKKHPTPKSDKYVKWLDTLQSVEEKMIAERKKEAAESGETNGHVQDHRAGYVDPPLRPSEKRRIYYGPETPVLAPLTTQGNLPFRRLCVELGAQVTWSEMAMGLPLLSGDNGEWALMKAHESELLPPTVKPSTTVLGYDNSKDIRFGAQIAANKPWLAIKTTEVLTDLCPNLRAIDLNCGCPIDLVFKQGAGSALMDSPGKMEKILRGMNTVSKDVPITVKIRMGTKDRVPTAERLCQRLVMGGQETIFESAGPAGVAAITLHGRSRQQRYSRSADWTYIASCAQLIKSLRTTRAAATDTIREPDARDLPAGGPGDGLPYFCGNGDVLSHVDYQTHIAEAGVDACMVGRGALVKPWLFEEIAAGQYLDKSAAERLGYVERFVRHGLEYWGSDEIGVGTTRRFLLEWLSFSCRYVPIGLLEYLPPKFGDRPPAFRGRDEMETLLSSSNYKDWIKISEMFLGPAHKDFHFQPKHRSNSYEIEAEG